jgi:CheY-like chemotaxis protein
MNSDTARKKVILVVEDMDDVREIAALFLAESGYSVFEARNATEALTLLRGPQTIDLLFTDVLLGGGENGLRLAREAIILRPNLRVLYTTGYSQPVREKEPMVARGEMVQKPYNLAALAEKVGWTLRAKRLELNWVLRHLWQQWNRAGEEIGSSVSAVLERLHAIRGNVALAAVEEPPPRLQVRYLYFGETLVRWAGQDLVGMFVDELARGGFHHGCLRGRGGEPPRRYAASAFRGTHASLTERLLLPLPRGARR